MTTPAPEPRLSRKERITLDLLVQSGELFGQELVRRSNGELGRGTVYVTLDRLEDKGFVQSRTEARQPGAIGLPRRLYQVTGLGRTVLHALDLGQAMLAGYLQQHGRG